MSGDIVLKPVFSAFAFIGIAGCSMPDPKPVDRLTSPDGKAEITIFHDEPGGTIDDTLLVMIDTPGKPYDRPHLRASIKRARNLHLYWTGKGRPVLAASDYEGWISSSPTKSEGVPNLILCERLVVDCEAALPPSDGKRGIMRAEYLSGESDPFKIAD